MFWISENRYFIIFLLQPDGTNQKMYFKGIVSILTWNTAIIEK